MNVQVTKSDLEEYLHLLKYELALKEAEEDLLRFAEVTMLDPKRPDDPQATLYMPAAHHRFMARKMMDAIFTPGSKLIINTAPRHGKSELCTRRAAAWYTGLFPHRDVMVATYNENFASDFSKDVRAILASKRFHQIFPDYGDLVVKNDEHLKNKHGGNLYFIGRNSTTTGRGADLILVDDPTKNEVEVRTLEFRQKVWEWFTKTLLTRRHTDKASIAISQTRWNEDDLVGRLTDPNNPAYAERFAKGFEVINLAAIAEQDDPLGRDEGEPLWPERFGIEYLEQQRDVDPGGFAALYQSNPTPDDGVFYQAEDIHEYDIDDLPANLRMYVVSDHAVSTKQINDKTCIVPFGICENGFAWVLPKIVWRRMDTHMAVEEMIRIMDQYKPLFWYGEKGQISKSIGPYLRKRQTEEEIYCPVIEQHPAADKQTRAHPARARCAQGRILFPKQASWWPAAKSEMLKFPNGRFDDFCDCVSLIGMNVHTHTGPGTAPQGDRAPKPGTFGHMLAQFRQQDADAASRKARSGW